MGLSTTYTKAETDFLLQKLESELASGLIGSLKITDTVPTAQGLYILSDEGTYTNLGGLVAAADKLNYGYFDGTTWSLIAADLPQPIVNNVTNNNNYTLDPDQIVPSEALYNSGALAGDITKRISVHSKKEVTYKEVTTNENGVAISDSDLDDTNFYIKVGDKYYQQVISGVINVQNFGLLPGQNCGAKFNKLLQRFKNKGATFYFPSSDLDYIFEQRIIFPYEVKNNTPTQKPFKIVGDGSYWNGKFINNNGKKGSCIQLAYNGDGTYLDAKITSFGLGSLTIEDITFEDDSGDNTPFFYGTYTTWKVSRCAFLGSKINTECDQDVFILGGTDSSEIGDVPNGGFQGYGTIISENYFNKIRRGLLGQNYFNANTFKDNTFWFQCGNSNGGAIELDGSHSTQTCTGNVISGNLCEMLNYKYFFKGNKANNNTFVGNNLFDMATAGTSEAYYNMENSEFNVIVHGWHNDNIPDIIGSQRQTVINSHDGALSKFQRVQAKEIILLDHFLQSPIQKSPYTNVRYFTRYFEENKEYELVRGNNDNSENSLFSIKDYGDGYFSYNFQGIDPRLDSQGSMRIRTANDKELFLGSPGKEVIILKGAITLTNQSSAGLATRSIFANVSDNNLTYKSSNGQDFTLNRFAPFSTNARPSASVLGEGARIYDTDLKKPLWSDGSAWKDATGTTV